eukprot:jgi/Psemu1/19945/gm1.19945_g
MPLPLLEDFVLKSVTAATVARRRGSGPHQRKSGPATGTAAAAATAAATRRSGPATDTAAAAVTRRAGASKKKDKIELALQQIPIEHPPNSPSTIHPPPHPMSKKIRTGGPLLVQGDLDR